MEKISLKLFNICINVHASIMFGCKDTQILVNNGSNWNPGKCKKLRLGFGKYLGVGRKTISKFGSNVSANVFEKLITSMESKKIPINNVYQF